jgi:hypothetical protein
VPPINNVATASGYAAAATVEEHDGARATFTVANAAVYYQLGTGWPGVVYGEEHFAVPGVYSLERRCTGLRFRSAAAAKPARVTAELVAGEELPGG